jgi:hypothetical protein
VAAELLRGCSHDPCRSGGDGPARITRANTRQDSSIAAGSHRRIPRHMTLEQLRNMTPVKVMELKALSRTH